MIKEKIAINGVEITSEGKCPCCGQTVGAYKRNLTSAHARNFLRMLKAGKDNFHHYKEVSDGEGTDFSKPKYWGLLIKKPNEDPKMISSGFWKLTDKAILFIKGSIGLPKYAYVYNDRVLKFSDEEIKFLDLWNQEFDAEGLRVEIEKLQNKEMTLF